MKWLALILILANVAFVGWRYSMRLNDTPVVVTPPPLPVDTPTLQLLSEVDELPARRDVVKEVEPAASTVEAPTPVGPAATVSTAVSDAAAPNASVPEAETTTNQASPSNHCIEIGPLASAQDVTAIEQWLSPRAVATHKVSAAVEKRRLYNVYLEAKTANEAAANVSDLERKGVRDILVIAHGDLSQAISLGVFSSHAAVNRRLAEITKQGYQPVVVPQIETTERYWVRANLKSPAEEASEVPTELLHGGNFSKIDCEKLAEPKNIPTKIVEPAPTP